MSSGENSGKITGASETRSAKGGGGQNQDSQTILKAAALVRSWLGAGGVADAVPAVEIALLASVAEAAAQESGGGTVLVPVDAPDCAVESICEIIHDGWPDSAGVWLQNTTRSKARAIYRNAVQDAAAVVRAASAASAAGTKGVESMEGGHVADVRGALGKLAVGWLVDGERFVPGISWQGQKMGGHNELLVKLTDAANMVHGTAKAVRANVAG
jgi:hypothetical protein